MLYKTKITVMPTFPVKHTYPCPICSKDIYPGDKYMFIDSQGESSSRLYASGYTCLDEECIQMRIFQMME